MRAAEGNGVDSTPSSSIRVTYVRYFFASLDGAIVARDATEARTPGLRFRHRRRVYGLSCAQTA